MGPKARQFLTLLAVLTAFTIWQVVYDHTRSGAAFQEQLKNAQGMPTAGDPHGDVTIAEFFDYHCGYCKAFRPTLDRVREQDAHLRVVYIDYPVFGGDSVVAAKAALAVASIDAAKYPPFHAALMEASSRFNEDNLADRAQALGIERKTFLKALADPARDAELRRNYRMAVSVHAQGVPILVIGDKIIPGAVDEGTLMAQIAGEREVKKTEKDKIPQ